MSKMISGKLGNLVKDGGGKIHTGPFGSQLHASDYVSYGIPCVMPANMKNNYVDLTGIAYISQSDADRLSKYIVKKGDIVYSRRGDVTQKALIRSQEEGYFCGTGCLLLRPGSKFSSEYLTYYLSTPSIKKWIVKQAVGATMPNLNTAILASIPFNGPDKNSQDQIALVITAIDKKIELNNKINTELEAMAKTLYDYWFVQFDFPDENGKPYKSSGGKMVYNEQLKREIPDGWEDGTLLDISKLIRGVTYTKSDIREPNSEGSIPILRATNITNNKIDLDDMVYVSEDLVSEKQLMNKYDVLMTMSSGSIDHIGKNALYYFNSKVSFGAFCGKLVAQPEYQYFLYSFTQSDFLINSIRNECLGTNINNLNASLVNGFKLILPKSNILYVFNKKLDSIYEKIENLENENLELSKLRDFLLPMLMNGQVTVT